MTEATGECIRLEVIALSQCDNEENNGWMWKQQSIKKRKVKTVHVSEFKECLGYKGHYYNVLLREQSIRGCPIDLLTIFIAALFKSRNSQMVTLFFKPAPAQKLNVQTYSSSSMVVQQAGALLSDTEKIETNLRTTRMPSYHEKGWHGPLTYCCHYHRCIAKFFHM